MKISWSLFPCLPFLLGLGCFHKATPVSDTVVDKNIDITISSIYKSEIRHVTVNLASFLRDAYTTRYEIEEKFGEPQLPERTFRNRRILIYEIEIADESYQLVLVFEENNILARHSLVKR